MSECKHEHLGYELIRSEWVCTDCDLSWVPALERDTLVRENDQLRGLLQEMRDALENLAAEKCECKTPCRVQYAHDLVDKADEKLKPLRGE